VANAPLKSYSVQDMKATKRVIMRIDVSAGVTEQLGRTVDEFGSTNIAVVSRLVDCLVKLDDETQATILGLMPKASGINATARVLESVRKAKD
jgi:hypothetical protein